MERVGKEQRRVEERIPKQENLHHKSAKRLFYFILSLSCTHTNTHTYIDACISFRPCLVHCLKLIWYVSGCNYNCQLWEIPCLRVLNVFHRIKILISLYILDSDIKLCITFRIYNTLHKVEREWNRKTRNVRYALLYHQAIVFVHIIIHAHIELSNWKKAFRLCFFLFHCSNSIVLSCCMYLCRCSCAFYFFYIFFLNRINLQ